MKLISLMAKGERMDGVYYCVKFETNSEEITYEMTRNNAERAREKDDRYEQGYWAGTWAGYMTAKINDLMYDLMYDDDDIYYYYGLDEEIPAVGETTTIDGDKFERIR